MNHSEQIPMPTIPKPRLPRTKPKGAIVMKDFYTAYTIGKQGGIISAIDISGARAGRHVMTNPLVLAGSVVRLLYGSSFIASALITAKSPTGQVKVKGIIGPSFYLTD